MTGGWLPVLGKTQTKSYYPILFILAKHKQNHIIHIIIYKTLKISLLWTIDIMALWDSLEYYGSLNDVKKWFIKYDMQNAKVVWKDCPINIDYSYKWTMNWFKFFLIYKRRCVVSRHPTYLKQTNHMNNVFDQTRKSKRKSFNKQVFVSVFSSYPTSNIFTQFQPSFSYLGKHSLHYPYFWNIRLYGVNCHFCHLGLLSFIIFVQKSFVAHLFVLMVNTIYF